MKNLKAHIDFKASKMVAEAKNGTKISYIYQIQAQQHLMCS